MNYLAQVEVDASAGSAAMPVTCTFQTPSSGSVCSFGGIPSSKTADLILEILPASSNVATVTAQGFAGTFQALWSYRYVFGGLTIQ